MQQRDHWPVRGVLVAGGEGHSSKEPMSKPVEASYGLSSKLRRTSSFCSFVKIYQELADTFDVDFAVLITATSHASTASQRKPNSVRGGLGTPKRKPLSFDLLK